MPIFGISVSVAKFGCGNYWITKLPRPITECPPLPTGIIAKIVHFIWPIFKLRSRISVYGQFLNCVPEYQYRYCYMSSGIVICNCFEVWSLLPKVDWRKFFTIQFSPISMAQILHDSYDFQHGHAVYHVVHHVQTCPPPFFFLSPLPLIFHAHFTFPLTKICIFLWPKKISNIFIHPLHVLLTIQYMYKMSPGTCLLFWSTLFINPLIWSPLFLKKPYLNTYWHYS